MSFSKNTMEYHDFERQNMVFKSGFSISHWKIYTFFETMYKNEITPISDILMTKNQHFFLKTRVFFLKLKHDCSNFF